MLRTEQFAVQNYEAFLTVWLQHVTFVCISYYCYYCYINNSSVTNYRVHIIMELISITLHHFGHQVHMLLLNRTSVETELSEIFQTLSLVTRYEKIDHLQDFSKI